MILPSFVTDLTLPPWEYHCQLREWCKTMRASHPVIYDEEGSTWLVFHYEDVVRVQNDYATFSSAQSVKNGSGGTIIEMDPPRHRQMRSLITQAFSARTVAEMAPRIEVIANDLLDKALPKGEMDWMAELANPMPVIVIADMLGLPRELWPQFKEWTDAIMNHTPEHEQAVQGFSYHFAQAIEKRRQHPGADVLSLLIESEVDGERLSFEDLVSFCFTLFIAGNITTTNVLGNSMLCFDAFPGSLKRLQDNPELLPTAVEEAIRYVSPFRAGPNDLLDGRLVTKDVQIGDQLIRKGEKVQVSRISANFDEQQFPDPDCFNVARNPNRHQSFGHGVHFCIGAPLARLEIKAVFGAIAKKFKEMHLVHDEPLEQAPSTLIFGVKRVPLAFQVAQ